MRQGELSAAGSALLLTLVGSLSQVISFCYRVALSRIVGAEVMGLYQLLMPVYSVLISITAVGVTAAIGNLTPQYLALRNSRAVKQTLRLGLTVFFCALLPTALAVAFFCDPISVYLLGDARTQLGLLLLLPCVALTGVENIHKHFFYGAGLVRPPAIADLLEQGVRAAAVLGLLLLFPPAYPEVAAGTIMLGMTVCEIFSSLTLTLLCRRHMGRMGLTGPGEHPEVLRRRVACIGLPAALTALLGNLMGAANAALLPQLLIQRGIARSDAMARFGVICGMTLPMLALPTVLLGALNLVLVPRLARSTALNRPEDIHRRIHRALLVVSVSMLPAMGLLSVVGSDLGAFLFHQEGVGTYLLPLAVASALGCYHSVLCACLNGVGRQSTSAIISILSSAGQLGITILLVPRCGMGGFVAAVVAVSLVETLAAGAMVVRYTGLALRLFQCFTAPALGTLLMALTGNLLFRFLKDGGYSLAFSGLFTALFSLVLYICALQAQGLRLRQVFHVGRPRR